MKFWTGETISLLGTQITGLALPLAADMILRATPAQVGFLNAAGFVPYLFVTLFAGIWVDRYRRRPLLVGASLARGFLLALIPISYVLGFLRMELLYLVTLFCGGFSVLFELAYVSYLPSLVDRTYLVEGNSKLQMSSSVAQASGPGLAGLVVAALSAPLAIAFDAASYLASAVSLALIRKPEPELAPPSVQSSKLEQVGVGMRMVLANPYLRAVAGEAATFNFGSNMTWAVLILYMRRELGMSPTLLGFVVSAASLGAFLGSHMAGGLGKRYGTGPTIVGSMALACGAGLLYPLAAGPLHISVPVLVAGLIVGGAGVAISVVHVVSLRQAITPQHMMGRVSAGYRFLTFGPVPIGAALGGLLGSLVGLRLTLLIGAICTLSALGWVLFSRLPALRELPEEPALAS